MRGAWRYAFLMLVGCALVGVLVAHGGTPVAYGSSLPSLPNLNTYVDPEFHAQPVSDAVVLSTGQSSIPGVGPIISPARASTIAEHVAVTDETANPQAVRVSAVRLVLADAPHLPMVGRRPLWLVTVAGFPNPAAPLVYPDAELGRLSSTRRQVTGSRRYFSESVHQTRGA